MAKATTEKRDGHGGNGQVTADHLRPEFEEFISSIQSDRGVQEMLDSLPVPSAPDQALIVYRDAHDIRDLRTLSFALLLSLGIILAFAGGFIYLMLKKPILIVQDRTSGETLVIDGRRAEGKTATLEVGPESLNDQGKRSIVTHFLESLYGIDQANRGATINKAIRMMDPDGALVFSRYLRDNRILEIQGAEEWQATWKLQDISIDESDPYILRAFGEQVIKRKVNGAFVQETRQLTIKLLLSVSTTNPKRNDNNLNTGFQISKFKVKVVGGREASPVVLMAETDVQ